MTTKESNPKDLVGIEKVGLSTLPKYPLMLVALAMLEGARKYGRHNYRTIPVVSSVYLDAAFRHLIQYEEGEYTDKDSGLPHLAKAIASILVLLDGWLTWNVIDDRPPRIITPNWIGTLNDKAKTLIDKYPNPVKPFTQKETGYNVDRTDEE